jgi:flagellar biosynthetic protein FliQ
MTGPEVLDIARDGIIVFLKVSMPVMLIGLVVGLAISVVQALTQVQEQTLIYVPKIVSIFLGLMFLMPFMSEALASYMTRIASRIATGV